MIQKRRFFFAVALLTLAATLVVPVGAVGVAAAPLVVVAGHVGAATVAAPRAIFAPEAPLPAQQTGRSATVAGRPNFSGTWRLDVEASDVTSPDGLAGLGGAAPENLYITQARNGALILSSRVNGAQPRTYIIGGENPLPAPGGEAARMTMSSRWEGSTLVSEGSGEFEGSSLVVREVMSLSPDGRTLRLEVTTTLAGAGSTNTLIYSKAGS